MAEYTVVTKDREYVPKWDGNREKPDPIRFTLRYLTNAERSRCWKVQRTRDGDIQIPVDNELLVRMGVKSISGFVVNGKPVLTAEDFMSTSGFDGLFVEVSTEILGMNAREDTRPLP